MTILVVLNSSSFLTNSFLRIGRSIDLFFFKNSQPFDNSCGHHSFVLSQSHDPDLIFGEGFRNQYQLGKKRRHINEDVGDIFDINTVNLGGKKFPGDNGHPPLFNVDSAGKKVDRKFVGGNTY